MDFCHQEKSIWLYVLAINSVGLLVDSSISTRRAAFKNYSNKAQSWPMKDISPHCGIPELKGLAQRDSKIKKSMDLYGWHQGHKVFAADSLTGLQLIANAGAMTYRSQHWRTRLARDRPIPQVMPFPFAMKEDDFFKVSTYVPNFCTCFANFLRSLVDLPSGRPGRADPVGSSP